MDVVFHWVKYQNIMSVGAKPITVVLDQHKKTLVTGTNGAGKSTFIEALTFLLYGKAFRDITKAQLVNSQNKKGLFVEGELSVGKDRYHIERGIKPNVLKIQKNGVPLKEVASATEYQAYFENELLGINYDSFKQIIVLGTAGYKPFMELPAGKRRELVEDLLDVSVIGEMDKQNKGLIKELKSQQDLLKVKLESATNEVESAEGAIAAQQKQTNMMIVMLTTNFREIIDQAKDYKERAAKSKTDLDNLIEPVYIEQDDSTEIAERRGNLESQIEDLRVKFDDDIAELKCQLGEHHLMEPYECALDHDVMMLEDSKPTEEQLVAKTALVPIPDEPVYAEVVEPVKVDVREDIQFVTKLSTAMQIDKSKIMARREFFEKGGACPTCGTDCSTHSHERIGELDVEIAAIDAKIAEQEAILAELNAQELAYNEAVKQYRSDLDSNTQIRIAYERQTAAYAQACRTLSEEHNEEIRRIDREIESMKLNHVQQVNNYHNKLNRINNEIRDCENYYKEHRSELEQLIDKLDDEAERKRSERETAHNLNLARYNAAVDALNAAIISNTESYDKSAENAKNLKNQIDELKAKEYDCSQVEDATKRLNDYKKEIATIVLELHHRSIVGEMLKDNGVKAHIVKRYIPVFNKKINEYLKSLGADYVFALDESFNESIRSRGREDFCYASFSEGEKARINLSLLFTWRDVSSMISGVNINLLCMDEVFDGSCDDVGIAGINRMLDKMKSNILVISHRKDAGDDSFNRHIRMHKQGRFTTMVENVR
ncbi:recombination endonuclease subunit [Aeromonas phage AsFcp_4]|nr:recombination endonuclease subunit [Aeromonas phage AsFcp_2]QAX99636.1 recombination endonuclease subunit [Aeromonas phage AsFcp_4]